MFAVEIPVALLIWLPRRPRFVAFWAFTLLHAGILLTGNYTFFNFLGLALGLTLLDDAALVGLMPHGVQRRLGEALARAAEQPGIVARRWRGAALLPVGAAVLTLSLVPMIGMFGPRRAWPAWVVQLHTSAAPFRSVNGYGLFAIMTTSRLEIVLEGSSDGRRWLAYEFTDKPGDVKRRPRFVAPHQPRLDWQMWFAALGDVQQNSWFVSLSERLLEGQPEVLRLLRHNPFPDFPPRHVRAVIYEYHFTTPEQRLADGSWWRRQYRGIYLPSMTRKPEQQQKGPVAPVF